MSLSRLSLLIIVLKTQCAGPLATRHQVQPPDRVHHRGAAGVRAQRHLLVCVHRQWLRTQGQQAGDTSAGEGEGGGDQSAGGMAS